MTKRTDITPEVQQAKDLLGVAAGVMERWIERLCRCADRLPDPIYDIKGSPLNEAAMLQGLIRYVVDTHLRMSYVMLLGAHELSELSPDWLDSEEVHGERTPRPK